MNASWLASTSRWSKTSWRGRSTVTVLTTGFMGGLTTYSSFNLETTLLLRERAWAAAALNLGATLGGCFLAGLLGLVLGAPSLGLTTGEAVRICLATAGLWWGAFTVFTVSRLRNRPVRADPRHYFRVRRVRHGPAGSMTLLVPHLAAGAFFYATATEGARIVNGPARPARLGLHTGRALGSAVLRSRRGLCTAAKFLMCHKLT